MHIKIDILWFLIMKTSTFWASGCIVGAHEWMEPYGAVAQNMMKKNVSFNYLNQSGYVLTRVCMCVILSVNTVA